MAKVKVALAALTSDEVKAFMREKKIVVAGFELGEEDLASIPYLDVAEELSGTASTPLKEGAAKYETHTDRDVVILLDILLRPELVAEGRAREVVNRIQQLRKKAGCVATDDIDVYYSFEQGLGEELSRIIVQNGEVFQRVLRRMPMPESERAGAVILMEEETEVGEEKMRLVLVRA